MVCRAFGTTGKALNINKQSSKLQYSVSEIFVLNNTSYGINKVAMCDLTTLDDSTRQLKLMLHNAVWL